MNSTEHMPSPHVTNKRVKDPEDMGDAFNYFFLIVTENLNLCHMGQEKSYITFKQIIFLKFSRA